MNSKHFISVICPIYNEEKYIAKCIDSILTQDYPKEYLEIFFIDGMSSDKTREIIATYAAKYPFITLLDNPQKIVPTALNIGIAASKGDVIIRLDAHCIYPKSYFSLLTMYLFELGADNVGALCRTLPINDQSQSRAVAIVSSHRFGVGNSLFRVGVDKIIETDTVPFGCFKSEVFDRIGLFDTALIRNQDDEFNARIIKNGGQIFLIPELVIDYFARDKISKMANMFYQYGLFKPLVNKKLGSVATLRQFFPLAFLLGVVIGGLLSIFFEPIMWIYISVLSTYLLLGLYFGAKSSTKYRDWKLIFLLPITFFVIHISYGWGYMRGVIKFLICGSQRIYVDINR